MENESQKDTELTSKDKRVAAVAPLGQVDIEDQDAVCEPEASANQNLKDPSANDQDVNEQDIGDSDDNDLDDRQLASGHNETDLSAPRRYRPVDDDDSIQTLVAPVLEYAAPDDANAKSLTQPASRLVDDALVNEDESAGTFAHTSATQLDSLANDEYSGDDDSEFIMVSSDRVTSDSAVVDSADQDDLEYAFDDTAVAPEVFVVNGATDFDNFMAVPDAANATSDILGRGVGAYAKWRADLGARIELFRTWLREQKIADSQTEDRIDAILQSIDDDKLHAAFVAEFSRGKSELINAIFFGGMDRRVLPSSAGRTTMCPTELLYDAEAPIGIRLLDIDTRLTDKTIAEYKRDDDAWSYKSFDPNDAESVRRVLEVVTETRKVSFQQASELALTVTPDQSETPDANASGVHSISSHAVSTEVDNEGLVEIPRWRHAIINYPHPLLEQGLVVLDTPGLNALGAEPELTLNMLAQAHAVVFILAADAGVTASDLAVWENHIRVRERASEKGKLVALNKIDFLWDELLSADEISNEQARMVRETAGRLAVPTTSIFPLSAQKALVGKIRDDDELIKKSRIEDFEHALANILVPAKSDIVRDNVRGQLDAIATGINAIVGQRLQDVDDHMMELEQLNSKNMQVIEDMMEKVRMDKESLEDNLHRFQSTRQVFTQQSTDLYSRLSLAKLEQCIMETKRDMELSLTTPGLRGRIVQFFQQTENMLLEARASAVDIHELMEEVYKVFQEENNLGSVLPHAFDIERYQQELESLQDNHNHFVNGLGVVFMEQKRLVRKFFETVVFEVRQIFERCTREADTWLKTIMSPMESQVREHQVQLRRRLESIKRIHQASDTLEDRVAEIEQFRAAIIELKDNMAAHNEALDEILNRELTEALIRHESAA